MIDHFTSIPKVERIEKATISAIIHDPEEGFELMDDAGVTIDDFYHPVHKSFLTILKELVDTGREFDLVSFVQTLETRGVLEKLGGPSCIAEIYGYSPTTSHLANNLADVKDKALRRSLISAGEEIKEFSSVDDGNHTAEEAANHAEKLIHDVRSSRVKDNNVYHMNDLLKSASERFQEAAESKEGTGMKTGFPTFDHLTGGLKPGNLYVIAARPSMGKTALLLNLIEQVCISDENPTDFYSLEMNQESISDRLIASAGRMSLTDIGKGVTTKSTIQGLKRVVAEFKDAPLMVNDQAGMKASIIRSRTRRRAKKQGVKAVFVDYLQIMGAENKFERGDLRVLCMRALQELKTTAKESNVAVILLAQLSRAADGVDIEKHNFSFIKDCGNIEQDADLVLTIGRYLNDEINPESTTDTRGLNILKQRNGPTGIFRVNFLKESTRFYE